MIKFWYKRKIFNYILLPISFLWWSFAYFRLKSKSKMFKPLVICIGNISVGGGGKTPFTIFLFKELQKLGFKVGILSRGYKGKFKQSTLLVDHNTHSPRLVGDEAYLMSTIAPVMISKNRVLGVKNMEDLGYNIIIMDDGLQNPTIYKDINILLFNTLSPFGNGLIIPAGPLRESLRSVARRADIAVGVGDENHSLSKLVKSYGLDYLNADIVANTSDHNLKLKFLAFAGIAYPEKFFHTLKKYGYKVELYRSFRDHYYYTDNDIQELIILAQKHNLRLITTSKDYVKINPKFYYLIDKLDIGITLDESHKNYLMQYILYEYQSKKNQFFNDIK